MKIPFFFRIKGTVIRKIWYQVIFVCCYTSGLVCVHNYVDDSEITFPQSLIPVIGIVTGLLLVFKTNTSYDRYYEGRKIWSSMTHNIRALTRCIWVMVEEKDKTSSKELVEKASAINLLIAFPYAIKHYLREEYSYCEDDIYELVRHIPRFSSPGTEGKNGLEKIPNSKCAMCSQECLVDFKTRIQSTSSRTSSGKRKETHFIAFEKTVPSNIPIELTYCISSYINSTRQRGAVDPSTVTIMNASLNNLVDCLSGLERILRTPIPLAYTVHLHHAVWIYILALPFQLIGLLNWFTIPGVVLSAFAILGILAIGREIENPFGYEANDLPLDDYCRVLHKEILKIVGHLIPPAETWIMSEENHPLAPNSYLSAMELLKIEESEIRRILARGAGLASGKPSLNDMQTSGDIKASSIAMTGFNVFKAENSDELSAIIRNP